MANATLRERQTQYKSCPQELYKLNAQQLTSTITFQTPSHASEIESFLVLGKRE